MPIIRSESETPKQRKRKPGIAKRKGTWPPPEGEPEQSRDAPSADDATPRTSGTPATQLIDDFIDGHRPLKGEEWRSLPYDIRLQIAEMRSGIYRRGDEPDLTEGTWRTKGARMPWD
jgi:hypothetical protein